ncbi:MAG: sugar ABC transporter ATP-binding protein [Nocardioidaceae bacterium]|nr:sugar ABC transporter ATP-binding protein [Nocardioidaceae bacterium]
MSRPLVELAGVSKRFGGATALAEVDLTILTGEVHCLVGENGAGKSTLGKVVAGVHRADEGILRLRGEQVTFRSPRDSIAAGIAFIAQELAIVPDRSVLDNVFLGREGSALSVVRRRAQLAEYAALAARTGFDVDPLARAGSLRLAEQQKVEIMRALARDAELIIMDEPTASLGGAEADQLLRIIEDLRAEGRTVVFVTHFLADALAVADRVTVLKDGRLVRTSPAAGETPDSLVTSMLGRSLGSMFPDARVDGPSDGDAVLQVRALSRPGEFAGVDLEVRPGEIVGIAGLVGSGRTELVETLVGLRRPSGGSVRVARTNGPFRSPRHAQRAGLVMVPESRKDHGLVLGRTVRENVTLPHLDQVSRLSFVSRARQTAVLETLLPEVGLDPRRIDSPVGELSGGNQQKVMFARWLFERPALLIADEPTRGVDVGARAGLYALLRKVADEGSGVLFVSSDNEEVIGLADRVLVMRAGRVAGELTGEVTEDDVLRLMFADETREEIA